jgi:lipopolysaccharide biosynthesis glycosyltransferase
VITVFVGYDPDEAVAFHVCVNSIIRHATKPINIVPLALNLLNDYTETHQDGSNAFTYLRFLVPHLMAYQGHAIYIDGDMVVLDDISKLDQLFSDTFAVQVIKHDYHTTQPIKYFGTKNENYPRKNWSSVILWNCAHATNQLLTPGYVQQNTGAHLHRFTWLSDDKIGELPIEWNWLPDELGQNNQAQLLHYTLGIPCLNKSKTGLHTVEWYQERALTEYYRNNN